MTPGRACLAVFGILLTTYAYVYGGTGSNQNARFNLLKAMYYEKSLIIDTYQKNTGDKAKYQNHFYSSKPPALILLALPSFVGSAKLAEWSGLKPDSAAASRYIQWATAAGTVGLLAALGGVSMFLVLRRLVKPRAAFLVTMIVFLGTPVFPYSTVFFSHSGTVGLVAIALACAVVPKKVSWSLALLCGLAAGFAVGGEYVAGIAAGAPVLYLLYREWRKGLLAVLGVLPAVIVVLLYHWAAFDSPFTLGYEYEASYPNMMKTGILGIDVLTYLQRLPVLLVYPNKGLLFWSPVLVLVAAGFGRLYRKHRSLFWMVAGVITLHLILATSHRSAMGGAAVSARNYMPMIPYLAVPLAFGFLRFPKTGLVLGILSVIAMVLVAVVGVQVPASVDWPLVTHYLARLAQGRLQYNMMTQFAQDDVPAFYDVAPLIIWIGATVPGMWYLLGKKSGRKKAVRMVLGG